MGDRSAHNESGGPRPLTRTRPWRHRRWEKRMEVKEELGPHRVRRRPGGPNRMYFPLARCVRSLPQTSLFGSYGEKEIREPYQDRSGQSGIGYGHI